MATQKTVANRFVLNAVINGKTLMCKVVLDSGSKPLFQFLDKSTGALTQSWVGDGPSFHAECTDTSGTSYVVQNPVLHWNGTTEVTFDSDGNSAAVLNMAAGTFVKTVTDGVTHYQIVKEIFGLDNTSLNNADSDYFYITGTVTLPGNNGQTVQTQREDVTVVLSSMGGSTIYGIISALDIQDGADSAVQTAHLYSSSDGKEVTEGVTFKWYNISGSTATECTTSAGYTISGQTLTVPKDQVNGDELFRCDMTYNSQTVSAYASVHDYNDPYYIQLTETGTGGASSHCYGSVQEGETVTVQADIYDKDGNKKTDTGLKPMFHTNKADGTAWSDKTTTTSAATADTAKMSFTYDEIVAAGGGCTGYVTAEK